MKKSQIVHLAQIKNLKLIKTRLRILLKIMEDLF